MAKVCDGENSTTSMKSTSMDQLNQDQDSSILHPEHCIANPNPTCESVDFSYYLKLDSQQNSIMHKNAGEMDSFLNTINTKLERNSCDYLLKD